METSNSIFKYLLKYLLSKPSKLTIAIVCFVAGMMLYPTLFASWNKVGNGITSLIPGQTDQGKQTAHTTVTHSVSYDSIPAVKTVPQRAPLPLYRDTIHYYDTIPIIDTTYYIDSSLADIPIKIPLIRSNFNGNFNNKNLTFKYNVYTRGYHTSVDSVTFYNMVIANRSTTTLIREQPRPNRWSLNASIGYGITRIDQQLYTSPTLSIGIGYNIYSW